MIHLFTIGFDQKNAETFFSLLRQHEITVLVDTRLYPDTEVSAFARQRDLPFLLSALNGCDYRYLDLMAPTPALFDNYASLTWAGYERAFRALLDERDLIARLDRDWWTRHRACLLCYEHEPDECHRRLVAEYLAAHWPEVVITHLQ